MCIFLVCFCLHINSAWIILLMEHTWMVLLLNVRSRTIQGTKTLLKTTFETTMHALCIRFGLPFIHECVNRNIVIKQIAIIFTHISIRMAEKMTTFSLYRIIKFPTKPHGICIYDVLYKIQQLACANSFHIKF